MKNKTLPLILLASTTILVGCQKTITQDQSTNITTTTRQENSTTDTQASVISQESSPSAVVDSEEIHKSTYDIDMDDFTFSITSIQAKKGETITINLTNSEGNHDLVIDELDVHSDHLKAGDSQVLEIQIPETVEVGTEYEYYCSVGQHRQMGMVGTLTIVE